MWYNTHVNKVSDIIISSTRGADTFATGFILNKRGKLKMLMDNEIFNFLKFETGLTKGEATELFQELIDLGGIDTEEKLKMVVIGFILCKKIKGVK